MHFNYDYTSTTSHQFYKSSWIKDDFVSIQGICRQQTLKSMIKKPDINNKWTQFFIPKVIDIPFQKPDIESISTVYSYIDIIYQRVVKTPILKNSYISNWEGTYLTGKKLIVEGILRKKIIYTAAVKNHSMHSAHFEIPFSVFIIVDKDTSLIQKFKLDTCIEDIFTCRLSERSIFENTTIFIKATPFC